MKVYAIFDNASAVYGDPIISDNDNVAKRVFSWSLGDPGLPDYVRNDSVLYFLGYFDRATGMFTQDAPPHAIMYGSSVSVRDDISNRKDNTNEE